MYTPKSKFLRGGSGSQRIRIQGEAYNRNVARIRFCCIHCCHDLKRHNFGLVCSANKNHYGFILKREAEAISQEVRFMKIGKMFPSEYLRGIDVSSPMKVKILSVTDEMGRNRDTNKREIEYVMRFEGLDKKLRLNITMAKECAKILGDTEGDTDNWIGKDVTVYRDIIQAFGKEHIVPRIRKVKRSDKPITNDPAYKSIDDLLYALWDQVGLDEVNAKAALKQCGYTGFAPSQSGAMFDCVRALLANGDFEMVNVDEEPAPAEQAEPVAQ